MKIKNVSARMILDSRGRPTVEATVETDRGHASAAASAGTSTGRHEAKELRDGDDRWDGFGVQKAVSHVNVEIARAIKGIDATDQAKVDAKLTELDAAKKPGLGANALVAVSVAAFLAAAHGKRQSPWRAAAALAGTTTKSLPVPMVNVLSGGSHAGNGLAVQECLLLPLGFDTFSEALRAATETYHALGSILMDRGFPAAVGLEGGFAPDISTHQEALDLLVQAIERAGYKPGEDIALGLDVAASGIYHDGGYRLGGHAMTAEQLVIEYETLLKNYPLVSLEDPLAEDDWQGWQLAANRLDVQLVGDDLTVTNATRVNRAVKEAGISGVVLKPNQVGTLSKAQASQTAATKQGLVLVTSHRSGETTDDWIADLAVGWGAGFIKAGAPARGERTAKYNRLLAIEQEIGKQAVYPGAKALVTTGGRRG